MYYKLVKKIRGSQILKNVKKIREYYERTISVKKIKMTKANYVRKYDMNEKIL